MSCPQPFAPPREDFAKTLDKLPLTDVCHRSPLEELVSQLPPRHRIAGVVESRAFWPAPTLRSKNDADDGV